MVARVRTVAFQGIEAVPVDVQVMIAPGKVGMHIVGLPDKAVAESRERVQAALHASGLSMPSKKVTVNLAPADLPKEGSHYDLPIALGLMAALGAIPGDMLASYVVLGELSLDGTIAAVAGALPAAIGANAEGKGLICPFGCGPEAAWAGKDFDILAPRSLIAIANHFRGTQVLSRPEPGIHVSARDLPDLCDIKGRCQDRHQQVRSCGKFGRAARCPERTFAFDTREARIDCLGSGMNAIAWLEGGRDDAAVHRPASAAGIQCFRLSDYTVDARMDAALVLGFSGVPVEKMKSHFDALAGAIARS